MHYFNKFEVEDLFKMHQNFLPREVFAVARCPSVTLIGVL